MSEETKAPEEAEQPNPLWGLAKYGLAAAHGVSAMAAIDPDVSDAQHGIGYGAVKRVMERTGFNPAAAIMSRVNLAGAALDWMSGQSGENSVGTKLGRGIRSDLQQFEGRNGVPMMLGGALTDAAAMGTGTAPELGAAGKVGDFVRGRVGGALGRVLGGASEGATIGATTGVYDAAIQSAHEQARDTGKVDAEKVAARVLSDAPTAILGGAALGGAGTALTEGVAKYGAKFGRAVKDAASSRFMLESGMTPGEVRAANKAAGGQQAEVLDSLWNESSEVAKEAKRVGGIKKTPYDVAAEMSGDAVTDLNSHGFNARQSLLDKARLVRETAQGEADGILSAARTDLQSRSARAQAAFDQFAGAHVAELESVSSSRTLRGLSRAEMEAAGLPEAAISGMEQSMAAEAARIERLSKHVAKTRDQVNKLHNLDGSEKLIADATNAGSKAVAKAEAQASALEKLASTIPEDMADGGALAALRKAAKLHPELESAARGAEFSYRKANLLKTVADAQSAASRPLSSLPAEDALWAMWQRHGFGSLLAKGGAMAGGAVAGIPGAMVGGFAGKKLHQVLSPNMVSSAMRSAGGLAEAMGATLATDAALSSAVESLFGRVAPSLAAAPYRAAMSAESNPDDAVVRHVRAASSAASNPQAFMDRTGAITAGLPAEEATTASAKLAEVASNVTKNAPKAIVFPGVGRKPKFADSDMFAYEDYVAGANPAQAMKAIRTGRVSPQLGASLAENWPGIRKGIQERVINNLAAGKEMDTQQLRQVEILLGEALLPENQPDMVALIQRSYDQQRRTNAPSSQGGGSEQASKGALSKGSRTPMESLSAAR